MVFPPLRKLPERNLRLDQPQRREPQVDLTGLGEHAPSGSQGALDRSGRRPPFHEPPADPRHESGVFPNRDGAVAAGDEDIPTLTEVVEIDAADVAAPDRLRGDLGGRDSHPRRLEGDGQESDPQQAEEVLQRLLQQSDGLLQAQLQQALAPVIERAAATMARELHESLEPVVREAVARVVSEEINRLRTQRAARDRSPRT